MKRVIIFTILILSSGFLLENHTPPQAQGKPSSSPSRPGNEASTITGTIQSSGGSSGGGCFIATAAFGSSLAPQVAILRKFRDTILIKSAVGRSFIHAYDRYSPALAGIVEEHETLRVVIRFGLLPLVAYSYWSIVIGHGITMALFSGLFFMLLFCGFTKIRKGQAGGDRPGN
jgi:Na+-transporting NADH:ubiquinone oxidoreductase subunit NqrB